MPFLAQSTSGDRVGQECKGLASVAQHMASAMGIIHYGNPRWVGQSFEGLDDIASH